MTIYKCQIKQKLSIAAIVAVNKITGKKAREKSYNFASGKKFRVRKFITYGGCRCRKFP